MQIKFVDVVIETRGLSYKNAVKDVSFAVKRGDYVAIIGPNGGGKSTLVKLLLGLLQPSSGEIKLFGKKQKDYKDCQKIGYVAQRASQIDKNFPITVYETVTLGLAYKSSFFKRITTEEKEHIKTVMEKMGVWELKERHISELSGGQAQRVMIARALVGRPQILILDEPNTGVDTASQRAFYGLLRNLNQQDNITILFVTHDLGVIADDVNSVLCINQSLLACHNPHELLNCREMSKIYGIDGHLVCHHH